MPQRTDSAVLNRVVGRLRRPYRLSAAVLLRAALVVLVFAHAAFVFASIAGDAGVFMTIGGGILDGKLPYVDYVDHKPPGVYFTLAGIFAVVRSALAAKVLIFLVNLTTAALVTWVARRQIGAPYDLVAACLFLAGSLAYSGPRVYTEQFVALFGTLATVVYATALAKRSTWRYAAAGALVGVAILFKQTGLAFVGAFLFAEVVWGRQREPARRVLDLVTLLGGAGVSLGVAVAYFNAQGTLSPLLRWTLLVHAPGGPYTPNPFQIVAGNLREIGTFPLLWVLASTGFIFSVLSRGLRAVRLVAIVGLFSATPLLIRGWGHYYLQLLPFAALLGAFAVRELVTALGPVRDSPELRAVVAASLVVLTIPLVHIVVVTAVDDIARHNVFTDQRHGSFVQSETERDGTVLALGEQAEFYFLADRSPPNRHLYYLSINRRIADQRELRGAIDRRAIQLVVIGPSCQAEIGETCEHVRESYDVVRQGNRLAFYEPSSQATRTDAA